MFGAIGISAIFMMLTSFKRFTQVLLLDEKPEIEYGVCLKHSLRVKHCTFSWKKQETEIKEEKMNFRK